MMIASKFRSRGSNSTSELERLRRELSVTPGVSMSATDGGEFFLNGRSVRFGVEAGGLLELSCELSPSPPPWKALAAHAALPGSMRYAETSHGACLLAEVELASPANLQSVVKRFGDGARLASRRGLARKATSPPPVAHVQKLLADSGLPPDDIVEMEKGWELYSRIRGEKVAVQMSIVEGGLRVWRSVLTQVQGGVCRRAIASQALRLNAQVRRARLMRSGDAVSAEVWIETSTTDGPCLASSARAVAVAYLHSRGVLEILNRETDIAARYEQLFCGS